MVYSNSDLLNSYLERDLWSTDYFIAKKAEAFQGYTDGYACSLLLNVPKSSIDKKDEGFAILLS